MSDEQIKKSSRLKPFVCGGVLFVIFLTVVYPLSIVPVAWLQSHNVVSGYGWHDLTVYQPLADAYFWSPRVANVLDWYLTLFGPIVPYRTHGGVI
jgi:hypothetical protein